MIRNTSLLLVLFAGGVLASCKDSVGPAKPATFHLRVESGATPVRSVLLAIEGVMGEPTVLVGGTTKSIVTQSGSGYRVLLIGSIDATDLLEVEAASASATPTAEVLDASAGASAGYRRMGAEEISVGWTSP